MAKYEKKEYVESEVVKQLQQALQNQTAGKPGSYLSQNQEQLNTLKQKLQSREPFRYDLGTDPLYQQYKDQYVRQGRKAMMDTVGQAAALTGGYGNSYAQTAGQQTYGEYLQGLNAQLPELYSMAMSRYQMEGDQLMNQYAMLSEQEDREYSRYRDLVNDWNEETQRLYQQYLQERAFDYGVYSDEQEFGYNQYRDSVRDDQWNQSFQHQLSQAQQAYEQWLQEFEYRKSQDELAYQQWLKEFEEDQRRYEQEWAAAQAAAAAKRYGGSSGSSGKGSQSNEDVLKAQTFVENMLNGATSSRFDPARVISSTNALTAAQKQEAQKYLQTVLAAGRMK